jgi:hypothetical protein
VELTDMLLIREDEVFNEFAKMIGVEPSLKVDDLYAFWDNDSPIVLQAHIDIVESKSYSHSTRTMVDGKWIDKPPKKQEKEKKNIIRYRDRIGCTNGVLGGDDRAGVMAMIVIFRACVRDKTSLPSLLLTNKEESGSAGMRAFVKDNKPSILSSARIIIAMDRRGCSEYVYYEDPEKPVLQYIESFGFIKSHGSYSDGRIIATDWKIPHINLSIGYYDNHSNNEILHLDEMMLTANRVIAMIKDPIEKRYAIDEPAWKKNYQNALTRYGSNSSTYTPNLPAKTNTNESFLTAAEAKRKKRCITMADKYKLPYISRTSPFLDYLLPNSRIIAGYHIVSNPTHAKSLPDWSIIFDESIESDAYKVWRMRYGNKRKMYVASVQSGLFYLAIQSSGTYYVGQFQADEAENFEDMYFEGEKRRQRADKKELDKSDKEFLEAHGYCSRFYVDCSGACHGDRATCQETGGPKLETPKIPENQYESGMYYDMYE